MTLNVAASVQVTNASGESYDDAVVRLVLGETGLVVEEAENGRVAVERALAAVAEAAIDVFVDVVGQEDHTAVAEQKHRPLGVVAAETADE